MGYAALGHGERATIMYWFDHGMGGWGYAGMGMGMVLLFVVLLLAVALVVKSLTGDQRSSPVPRFERLSAEEILANRFAAGEISETDYRDQLAVLGDRSVRKST